MKFTATDLTQLSTNEASAVSAINANFATLETLLDTLFSRDGTSPNTMAANIDMDGNRILNLPTPSTSAEPVRQSQLSTILDAINDGSLSVAAPSVSNSGTVINSAPSDINFGDNIAASDDGDGTVTVSFSRTQSYFLAFHQASDNKTNVTGDGGIVFPTYSNVIYNVGSDYDETNVYTAPVEGLYSFDVGFLASGGGGAESLIAIDFVHSNYGTLSGHLRSVDFLSGEVGWNRSVTIHMGQGDTIKPQVFIDGGASNAMDISDTFLNFFSGALVREI